MAVIVKKKRLFNPHKASGPKKRKPTVARKPKIAKAKGAKRTTRPKRKNPASLMTLGALNPQKKRTSMTKKKTARKAPKRKNPFFSKKTTRKVSRRRRNPSLASKPFDLAKSGAIALLGLVATRQLPQLALGAKNTGWLGYLSNMLTAALAAAAANKYMSREAGKYVFIGGSVYTVSRILTEQFSPVGKYFSLSGVGDAQAAGLGVIRKGYFPVPVVHDGNGNPMIPQAIVDAVRAQIPAPAAASAANATMSGVSRYSR